MNALALVITRGLGPVVMVPVLFGLLAGLVWQHELFWQFFVILLVFDGLVPIGFVLYRYWRKGGDWDIKDSHDRRPLYVVSLVSNLVAVAAAYVMGLQPLGALLLGLWLLLVVFAGVNYVYKISIHVGVSSTVAFFATLLYGWEYGWVWLMPVLVGWSRVYLGKHQVGQVVLGGVVPVLFLGGYVRTLQLLAFSF